MVIEALEGMIPPDLDDAFNTLYLADEKSFQLDLEDATVLAEVEYGDGLVRYCIRVSTGEPMILIEGPGSMRLTFLPGQA